MNRQSRLCRSAETRLELLLIGDVERDTFWTSGPDGGQREVVLRVVFVFLGGGIGRADPGPSQNSRGSVCGGSSEVKMEKVRWPKLPAFHWERSTQQEVEPWPE